jgi:TRAP-type C4-dicarboxylate transport system permease small subunit
MSSQTSTVLQFLRRAVEFLCFLLTVSFVVVVVMAVVARYVINASLPWSEEFIRFSLFWSVVLGAIHVAIDDQHLRLEVIQQMLPRYLRLCCVILAHLATIGFCYYLFRYGWVLVERSTSTSPALQLPMSVVYAAMPVSAAGIALASGWHVLRELREFRK